MKVRFPKQDNNWTKARQTKLGLKEKEDYYTPFKYVIFDKDGKIDWLATERIC